MLDEPMSELFRMEIDLIAELLAYNKPDDIRRQHNRPMLAPRYNKHLEYYIFADVVQIVHIGKTVGNNLRLPVR